MSVYIYYLPEMGSCCVEHVERAVQDTPFKSCQYVIEPLHKTLTLEINEAEDAFKDLNPSEVNELMMASLRIHGFDEIIAKGVIQQGKSLSHAFLGGIGLSLGFLLMFASLIINPGWMSLLLIGLISSGFTAWLGWPFYRRAYQGLRQGIWSMDTLFSVSTLTVMVVSLGALFYPALPMMFESGLLIFGFRHAGVAISDAFKAKLLKIRRLQDDLPEQYMREDSTSVLLEKIKPGDRLQLSVGDMLPVDGVFESGEGMVSSLYQTGSHQSTPLIPGKIYPAGTMLVSKKSSLIFTAKKSATDSFLAREDRAILASRLNRALDKTPRKGDKIASGLRYFVPIVMLIAIATSLFVGLYGGMWIEAIQCGICVLVAACPCTLGLIIPLVRHVGISKIEKTGIRMHVPEHFEVVDTIDCVMIDLNGTLTAGVPKVKNISPQLEVLALMAHLEQGEMHWAAQAIKKAARNAGLTTLSGACQRLDTSTHHGRRVLYQGIEYVIGNRLMMRELGLDDHLLDVPLNALGETAVYLAARQNRQGFELKGHLVLEDTIRDGAQQMVRELQQAGKKVCLCTGADQQTANRYATALKIPVDEHHVFANCTVDGEHSKFEKLMLLKKQGHQVMMIGDAGNDARVVASSHFGVVVSHEGAHDGTQQGASAVLHSESLLPILALFKTARNTVSHIYQNLGLSFAYNLLAMLAPTVMMVGFSIVLNPAVSAALMILQTLLVLANVYRFQIHEERIPVVPSSLINSKGLTNERLNSRSSLTRVSSYTEMVCHEPQGGLGENTSFSPRV